MPRFNRELVLGVMNQGHLCDCTISTTDFNGAGTYLDALRAGEYHGVIWDRPEPAQHGIIDRLREACVPQVLVSRKYAGLPMVSCHYQEGMRQAVRYLYGIGHRSILLIDQPPEKAGIIRARQEAFLDQAERYGITKECQCLNHGEKTMRPEECDIARMLRVHRTFTAVIADSSFISMLKRCLDDAQLSVPGDLSVIQSGETDLFHRNSSHPFTILTDPRFEIGGMALELIGKLNRGEKIAPESEYLISGRLIADRGCAIPQNLRSILNQME